MAHDDIDALDSDLPLVRRAFPWPVRVGCVAAGAFAIVMPLWELGCFDAGCYGSQAYAERVRRALHEHLGL